MRVVALFSGGKDSTFALYETLKLGYDVVGLITVKPLREDSWMFHYPCINLTSLQAISLGIPIFTIETESKKEDELKGLKETLKQFKSKLKIDGVVSGAIASRYQKERIEDLCRELKLRSIAPLWDSDPETLLRKIISYGFEVVFTGVSAEGLTEEWLNRKLDNDAIEELKILNKRYGVHLSLEGGEGETFVKDAPLFLKRINFLKVEKIWRRDSGYILVRKAQLIDK